jgi:hypothetical protein
MRHLSWLVGLSSAFAWAVGCGGGSEFTGDNPNKGEAGEGAMGGSAGKGAGGSSGTSGSSVPLADTPEAYASAYCALLERCGGILWELTTAYEDCATLTAARIRQDGFDALESAVDDGSVEYHAELVPACLDAVRNRACDQLNERDIAACNTAIAGTAAEGEPCTLTEQCEGSLICETKDACPGSCVERYSAGVACAVDDECADGLVCSDATAHCVQPTAEGEPCGGGVEAQCEAGLFCLGDDRAKMQTGACAPLDSIELGGEGDACDPTLGTLCEAGLSCVLTGVEDAALVWECEAPAASGAACGIGIPEACPDGQYCPINAASVALGMFEAECILLPGAGEACAKRPLEGILPECVAYARCDQDGQCIGLRDLGESCSRDGLCYSGHCVGGACEPGHACDE